LAGFGFITFETEEERDTVLAAVGEELEVEGTVVTVAAARGRRRRTYRRREE
ncbi:hypothetical protein KIPB_014219, partial [Kipferlia bialata]